MKPFPQHKVNVLIIESDENQNNQIADRLEHLNQDNRLNKRYQILVKQFVDPYNFMHQSDHKNERNQQTIAFVSFNHGKELNGIRLSRELLKHNGNSKVILMTRSDELGNMNKSMQEQNNIYTHIVKHEYTPDICRYIVESYLNNL